MNDLCVKICGVTNPADAEAAIASGTDALGFNLWPNSKRAIDPAREREWIAALPAAVKKVAVMVNPSLDQVRAAFEIFDIVQLHGHESPEFCMEVVALGRLFWKALATRNPASLENVDRFGTNEMLLDAFVPGEFGGTGQLIDLDLAAAFIAQRPMQRIWLSGGLTPENVGEAIRRTQPFGVDVASGVESSSDPRRKDHAKIRAFIAAARNLRPA